MAPSRRTVGLLAVVVCLLAAGIALAITGTVPVSDGVSLQAPDGMNATLTGSTDAQLEEPFPTSGTVQWTTEAGNVSFFSSGSAAATVNTGDIEGTWTNITAIDADPNTVTVDPDDKDSAIVGQEINEFAWRSGIAADDGTVDFSYSASATGEVTVQGVAGSTHLAAVDRDTGNVLDESTSNSGGAITFDALDSGTHDVTIQTFTPNAPTFDNASPTGGQSSPPEEISIDVNDADFPRSDSVDVTIDVDGSQVHSETITSNSTVTASIPSSSQTGGSHSWSVEATDDYGETSSDSYSYSVPSELQIREESPAHDLIEGTGTNPITIEATFFEDVEDSPTIVNRTTTDGTISLDGLPVSSDFSVQVHAQGYHNRTVRLENIFAQSDVFLVNRNRETIENRFSISDRTGNFPNDETSLFVQAPVNESLYGSGGFEWKTVAGDDLGADESFVTDLIHEKRYRIVVQNSEGDTRILGSYTAESEGVIQMTIGRVTLNPSQGDFVALNTSWQNTTSGAQVTAGYNDTSGNTSQLHLHIYEYRNASNELVSNTSFSGPYGTFQQVQPVPQSEKDTTWVVKITGEVDDGENIQYSRVVGPGQPTLTDMPAYLVTIIFAGTLFMVAGLFSRLNGGMGAIVVAGVGGMFYFMGLVPDYLGGGVVALALLVAALLVLRERQAGGL